MRHLPRATRNGNPDKKAPSSRPGRNLRALPLALILGFALAGPALCEIYRWTDDSGTVHFSDSLYAVPERYRKQLHTRSSDLPPPPAAPPRSPAVQPLPEVPLEKRDSGYLVQARFNGRETARLVLDTGATSTVVSTAFASRAGLRVRKDPPVVLRTAGGPVDAGWAEVESIEVGDRRSGPLRVVVHDALEDADGLLGMNFLSAFRVEIRAQGPSLVLSNP